jgi:hypothetical protein
MRDKLVSEYYSYLALEEDQQLVTDWFAALPHDVTVNENTDRTVYYFRDLAKKPLPAVDQIDQSKTPLVFAFKPQKRLGPLWTSAEVLFTPTPFRSQFPALHKINKAFSAWVDQFELVFSNKRENARRLELLP